MENIKKKFKMKGEKKKKMVRKFNQFWFKSEEEMKNETKSRTGT